MERTIIHRIKEIIDHKSVSPRSFASKIGFNYSTLNNYLSGRRKSVDSKLLSAITSTYDDISSLWLLTGKGPMILSGETHSGDDTLLNQLREELEKAKETIYTLKGQNEILQEIVGLNYKAKKA